MKRFVLVCLLGGFIGLGGCFSPKIDLSGLDNIIPAKKDSDSKDKKDKEKKKKEEKKDD